MKKIVMIIFLILILFSCGTKSKKPQRSQQFFFGQEDQYTFCFPNDWYVFKLNNGVVENEKFMKILKESQFPDLEKYSFIGFSSKNDLQFTLIDSKINIRNTLKMSAEELLLIFIPAYIMAENSYANEEIILSSNEHVTLFSGRLKNVEDFRYIFFIYFEDHDFFVRFSHISDISKTDKDLFQYKKEIVSIVTTFDFSLEGIQANHQKDTDYELEIEKHLQANKANFFTGLKDGIFFPIAFGANKILKKNYRLIYSPEYRNSAYLPGFIISIAVWILGILGFIFDRFF